MIPHRKTWVGPVRREKRSTEKRRNRHPKGVQTKKIVLDSVDFVLVYTRNNLSAEWHSNLNTFLSNLEEKGFHLETVTFSLDESVNFVKIHAPKHVLMHFAEIFRIELNFQNIYFKPSPPKPYKFMATELTQADIDGDVFKRARTALPGFPLTDITNAERGLIIHKVLTLNSWGSEKGQSGIDKLLRSDVVDTVYPLHDGVSEWSEEGPLNERQLLKKYWGTMKMWYAQQPLDLIERYYGPETAFYFAWLGFYNKMLIPASIIGFVCFILGALIFRRNYNTRSDEVCQSNIFLCPRCVVENCKYGQLKNSCFHTYFVHLFDNPLVVTFAALMSIWSTVFLELWKREEAMLQVRWNVRYVEMDYAMRPEFGEGVKHERISKITGAMEPYVPRKEMCYRYAISGAAILLLVLVVVLVILSIMIYVKTMNVVLTRSATGEYLTKNVALIASSTGTIISVTFIIFFEIVYRKIALWLTQIENPRTQVDFDNSFTYKSYALAFVSNYSVIFYMAFIKARFYTYPGDERMWTTMGGLGSDLCDPAGCLLEVAIQLIITLLAKNLLMTAKQYVVPQLLVFFNKLSKRKTDKDVTVLLQWECDYLLNDFIKYYYIDEYIQMIIQYGFVTFFVAAFPLAPLLALFNNLIELRVDAIKLVSAYRRPVAVKIANLGAWNGILKGVTYIGVATNAFVIAFTSELVQREIYRSNKGHTTGFINSTLSLFNVNEFPDTFQSNLNISTCHYPGKRYPPDHERRYQLTDDFWYVLTLRFLAVIVFEHVVMLITGLVASAIPDLPFVVQQQLNFDEEKLKDVRTRKARQDYLRRNENNSSNIFGTF